MTGSSKWLAIVAIAALSGCGGLQSAASGGITLPGTPPLLRADRHRSPAYIKHVVIVIQENRSFDNFFATFPGADGATRGLMKTPKGDVYVKLTKDGLNSNNLGHSHSGFVKEFDGGKMDGFAEVNREVRHGEVIPAGTYVYRYVDPKDIVPYWDIAKEYVLADHMFTTQSSSSFTAHQDFIAGGTPVGDEGDNVIDFPVPISWGCNAAPGTVTSLITTKGHEVFGAGPFPCFKYKTLRDLLDAKGLSWRYFTNKVPDGLWDAFDAISAVYNGSQWKTNIVVPETKVFDYLDSSELPAVSWVIPDAPTSDHPSNSHDDQGPEWIASVVDAVGESPYWDSTVVIVVWDDWGGEYDHVPPPQLDGQGLGMRVPMLIISAYDKETSASQPGYISHTQYEDGSLLKFIEQNWHLGSLGTTDVRANSIADCFDFSQKPRPFVPIPQSFSRSYWKHYNVSSAPIDEY
jgi:phospholipase C